MPHLGQMLSSQSTYNMEDVGLSIKLNSKLKYVSLKSNLEVHYI